MRLRMLPWIAIACLLSGPAAADEFRRKADLCGDYTAGPDRRIGACTWLLESGQLSQDSYSYAYNNRGTAYWAIGAHDRAIRDYDEAIRLNPRDYYAYSNRANSLSAKGEYDRAILDYNEAIRLNARFAEAYNNRANAYRVKGAYKRAIRDVDEAIRLVPDFAAAYSNRGLTYADLGAHDRAIRDFDEAIRLDRDYAEAHYNRGNSYQAKGDLDRAIRDYDEAIRLRPGDSSVYNNRGVAFNDRDDIEHAIRDFKEAIRLDPGNDRPYGNLARIYATARDARYRNGQEAVRLAQKTLALLPSVPHLGWLAAAYAELGRYEDALREQAFALEVLRTKGGTEAEIRDFEARYDLYKRGRPYRE